MKKVFIILMSLLCLILVLLTYWRLHRVYEDKLNQAARLKLEQQFNHAIRTKTSLKNQNVIGKIIIPSLSIHYIILNKTSDENLDISISKLTGPAINHKGNIVLAGHDMRNGNFFGKLKYIKNSDAIILEDTAGRKKTYFMTDKYIVKDTDLSPLKQGNRGSTLLTLITCTYEKNERLVVRAHLK